MALQDRRLSVAPIEEVKQCLRGVFALVGLRPANIPQAEDKEFLLGFILSSYGGHTPSEVRLAFTMALEGKLDVDATCYENFSPAYFARIMNAYRAWAAPQFKRLPAPEKTYTEEDKKRIDAEYLTARIEAAYRHHLTINKLPCPWPRKAP